MKKINLAFITILILTLSYTVADVFWLVAKPEFLQPVAKPAELTHKENLTLASNIFGNKKIVTVKSPVQVKRSKLNLDLIGVLFKRKDSKNSFAIIAPLNASALAKTYKVGDNIKTGVRVKEIGVDFVVLKRDTILEKLVLKRTTTEKDNIVDKIKLSKSKLSTIQKSKLDNYRLEIIENPKKLLSIVSVVPYFKNGKMLGVKVKPNKDKDIFNDLGFKSGDIITKINHTHLNNFNKFAKIRQIIYRSSLFDLKIKRNNETIYLSIQL